jgi:ubiquinone biosynthesis protein UbiJ
MPTPDSSCVREAAPDPWEVNRLAERTRQVLALEEQVAALRREVTELENRLARFDPVFEMQLEVRRRCA